MIAKANSCNRLQEDRKGDEGMDPQPHQNGQGEATHQPECVKSALRDRRSHQSEYSDRGKTKNEMSYSENDFLSALSKRKLDFSSV